MLVEGEKQDRKEEGLLCWRELCSFSPFSITHRFPVWVVLPRLYSSACFKASPNNKKSTSSCFMDTWVNFFVPFKS